jgi:hypothetical protein
MFPLICGLFVGPDARSLFATFDADFGAGAAIAVGLVEGVAHDYLDESTFTCLAPAVQGATPCS